MPKSLKNFEGVLVIIILNLIIWFFYFSNTPNDILKVTFLDVGQGDAIFVEAPNGKQLLIDGGKDVSVLRALGRVMSFSDRSIDMILVTHPDQDHIGGLPEVLERYEVSYFLDSFVDSTTNTYKYLQETLNDGEFDYQTTERGQVIALDKQAGVYIQILYPEPDDFEINEINELSVVVRVIYGDTSFMLTGDAGKSVEDLLSFSHGEYLKSSVLKAGHHGSNTSTSTRFLEAVNPHYIVISAGENNKYGHPSDLVVGRIEDFGANILETSKEGNITFKSNGIDVWVK